MLIQKGLTSKQDQRYYSRASEWTSPLGQHTQGRHLFCCHAAKGMALGGGGAAPGSGKGNAHMVYHQPIQHCLLSTASVQLGWWWPSPPPAVPVATEYAHRGMWRLIDPPWEDADPPFLPRPRPVLSPWPLSDRVPFFPIWTPRNFPLKEVTSSHCCTAARHHSSGSACVLPLCFSTAMSPQYYPHVLKQLFLLALNTWVVQCCCFYFFCLQVPIADLSWRLYSLYKDQLQLSYNPPQRFMFTNYFVCLK